MGMRKILKVKCGEKEKQTDKNFTISLMQIFSSDHHLNSISASYVKESIHFPDWDEILPKIFLW